jgi:hypothetical protein
MGLSKRSRGLTLMPRMGKERRQAPDRILARVVVFFGLALMVAGSARAERCRMYVGTYTDKDGEGIYSALLDMDTGEVGPLDLAVKTDNPSFLARDPGGDYLYAVNETQTFNGDPSGAVSVFSIGQGWGGVDLVPTGVFPGRRASPPLPGPDGAVSVGGQLHRWECGCISH